MRSKGSGFLHNGCIAWEIPPRIGDCYICGAYLPPAGWEVAEKLGDHWLTDEDGYIRHTVEANLSSMEGASCF